MKRFFPACAIAATLVFSVGFSAEACDSSPSYGYSCPQPSYEMTYQQEYEQPQQAYKYYSYPAPSCPPYVPSYNSSALLGGGTSPGLQEF